MFLQKLENIIFDIISNVDDLRFIRKIRYIKVINFLFDFTLLLRRTKIPR